MRSNDVSEFIVGEYLASGTPAFLLIGIFFLLCINQVPCVKRPRFHLVPRSLAFFSILNLYSNERQQ